MVVVVGQTLWLPGVAIPPMPWSICTVVALVTAPHSSVVQSPLTMLLGLAWKKAICGGGCCVGVGVGVHVLVGVAVVVGVGVSVEGVSLGVGEVVGESVALGVVVSTIPSTTNTVTTADSPTASLAVYAVAEMV